MKKGDKHNTNRCGTIEVTEYRGSMEVEVRFLETGYIAVSTNKEIRSGQVKDPLQRSVYGVGFVGEGAFKCTKSRKKTEAYSRWSDMLKRCYDPNTLLRQPYYADCKVCDDWHNFQVFAEWFYSQDYSGKQIDKDIKIKGNKIYSPETCLLVSAQLNTEEAKALHWEFVSPAKNEVKIYNLAKFCRENGLCHSSMRAVHAGKRNHHKQWRKDSAYQIMGEKE